MIPEAILVAILIAFFIADFASEKDDSRGWFNPFACVLMGVLTVVCILPLEPSRHSVACMSLLRLST